MQYKFDLSEKENKKLDMEVYKDISHPAAYGGIDALQKASNASKQQVKKFLGKNDTYRKFFRNKTKFDRARVLVSSVGHIFQADLFDLQKISRQNNGYRYILLVVDTFSRLIKVRPLKSKNANDTATAIKEVFEEFKKEDLLAPKSLLATDLGNEFWNSEVYEVLDTFDIKMYGLRRPLKCSIAEISGRHLLDRMYKYMHATNQKHWLSKLQTFVDAKNKRPNRTLGHVAPIDVSYDNQDKIYKKLYSKKSRKKEIPLEIGTKVQLALELLPFHKSFHGYFSDEVYEVIRRVQYRNIWRYSVKDSDNDEISGSYYRQELLPF